MIGTIILIIVTLIIGLLIGMYIGFMMYKNDVGTIQREQLKRYYGNKLSQTNVSS